MYINKANDIKIDAQIEEDQFGSIKFTVHKKHSNF